MLDSFLWIYSGHVEPVLLISVLPPHPQLVMVEKIDERSNELVSTPQWRSFAGCCVFVNVFESKEKKKYSPKKCPVSLLVPDYARLLVTDHVGCSFIVIRKVAYPHLS